MTQNNSDSVIIDTHVKKDFLEYIKSTEERATLFKSNFNSEIEELYVLLYLYTEVTIQYKKINRKYKAFNFINENKIDLMTSFDLLNINYIKSSKKTLRSTIESFFRFSLELARYHEYEKNKKMKIYKSTKTMKELKSMVDTHKVGKMTRYTLEFFQELPVYNIYCDLYNKYSYLSGYVHVNSIELFTPHSYLSNYLNFDEEEIRTHLTFFKEVLLDFILILYSHDIIYTDIFNFEKNFTKIHIQKIEYYGGEDIINILNTLDEQSALC